MHVHGNTSGFYASGPAFQQHPPATSLPPPPHHGPFAPQNPAIQHGHPYFHPTSGISAYRHGPPAPVASSVVGSPQPYLSHTQHPNVGNQISHSYPPSEQRVWSQNVRQLPPTAPLPGPSAYPLSFPQGLTLERGQSNQYISHGPLPGPPPLPPYSSSSSSLMASPFGSTALGQHSYQQMVGPQPPPLPPPPPPPPPPPVPPSSPPQIPPLPTSSPLSNVPSNNDETCSLKDLFDENNLILEHPFQDKHTEDRNVEQSQISGHHTENNGPKMETMDAVVAHSPAGSDMEMEVCGKLSVFYYTILDAIVKFFLLEFSYQTETNQYDISHPDVAKEDLLSTNANGGCTSISQEDFLKEQLQVLQHTREHKVSEDALHENLSFAEASTFKDQRGAGSQVMAHCDFPITQKVSSEADQSGITKNVETEQPFENSENDSSHQHKISSQPSVLVVCEETGCGELSGQIVERADAFNLLQCYASDNISENEGENLSGDVSSPAPDGGSTNFDAQEECSMGLMVRVDSLSASNKHMHPKSMIASPRNAMGADKLSSPVGIVEEFSDTNRRGHESITTSAALRSNDTSKSYDVSIDLEVARFHKQDRKIDPPELRVDQFGRLVREGVSDSDSDASDSPRYTRRHATRSRKKSSSRSRSRSPHDRRRRSPWRRNERRGRSRSLSPKRRRSRSRSPVLRRDTEFNGDKQRREKSQLPECFDFLRGKCYRGSTCRYFHHEIDRSEKLRYNRGNQLSTLRIPNVHEEGEVLYDKEVNDEVLPQDMPVLREVRDAKELAVGSNTHYPGKLNSLVSVSLPVAEVGASNLSDYSAHDMPSSKENTLVLESLAQNYDKMPQIVDQPGGRMVDSLVSESSLLVQASSAHLPGDRPDPEQRPTSQLLSVESPIAKPCSTEECQSQSLKELAASATSQFTLPLPSGSQTTSAPFGQDYNLMPPIARFQSTLESHSSYQAPVSYQHSPFPWPSSSLPSTYLPHPPPPPPHHLSVNVTLGEHDNLPQHSQQSLQPPWDGLPSHTSMRAQPTELPNRSQTYQYQLYPLPREADHMLHTTENFASDSSHMSNPSSLRSGHHIIGESVTGHPVQSMNPLQTYSQDQRYSLRTTSPSKAAHGSLGGGLPSDCNSSHFQPYFQKVSYNLQYSASGGVPAQYAQPENVSSSMSRLTPDFLGKNQPSYVHTNVMGSRIPNRFNPYASTFDLPLSSKFKLNASIQENDTIFKTKYGASVGSSSVHVDGHNVTGVVSKYMISSSSSELPAQSILPRPGGDQYDPLFDSIEPASTLFSRADHKKHETPGDSDNMHKFSGSGRVLNEKITKPKGGTDLSGNDSMENEEFGETAEAEIGDVSNGSPSNPNDATNLNTGEIEIDQVKDSREKRKGKDSSSMKLFKISVASFVKDVLKPSWRQGNMSKEAFKTIVKKTVDKVHGAMKGHRVPKSQAKINQYIDSSRGKLTKLVMGYVDKYVKV
ncbi:hypothetical protein OROGR_029263 [Orobanche gracilis]